MVVRVGEVALSGCNAEVQLQVAVLSPKLRVKWLRLAFSEKPKDELWFYNQSGVIWVFRTMFVWKKCFSGFSVSVEIEEPISSKGKVLVSFEDIKISSKGVLNFPLKFFKEAA